jgi:hypothetical protein
MDCKLSSEFPVSLLISQVATFVQLLLRLSVLSGIRRMEVLQRLVPVLLLAQLCCAVIYSPSCDQVLETEVSFGCIAVYYV